MNRTSALCRLQALGQSVWLDSIGRAMLGDGTLRRLIEDDCVSGLTSNPVLFADALRGSNAYDEAIAAGAAAGADAATTYERLAVEDIRAAADLLLPVHERTRGGDGFASLEVSPHLARDSAGTIAEARRLWAALGRPNVMIKVPGTIEGLTAIEALTALGINVNVTLLFSPRRYQAVADAYLAGLEARAEGGALPRSVASFFLSRVDAAVDPLLPAGRSDLRGKTSVSLAWEAHAAFAETIASPRWQKLAAAGAMPQRLLWASTGVKDPAERDVKYVEALIVADTVTTLPPKTLAAFRDHGKAELATAPASGRAQRADLAAAGIDMEAVFARLEEEGIAKFATAFDALLAAIEDKRQRALAPGGRS